MRSADKLRSRRPLRSRSIVGTATVAACDDAELHVHHCTYENYAQERLEDLITLCGTWHKRFHLLLDVS